MKALFISLYAATPHFETELELLSDLLDAGHVVHVVRCMGDLVACVMNPDHKEGWCKLCVSKIDAGLRTLGRIHEETLPTVKPHPQLAQRFESADELLTYTIDGAELGRGVYSTMCGRVNKDTRLDTHRYAPAIRKELESAYAVYAGLREVIERVRPDRVYIFNGRFSTCHAAVVACEQTGTTFVTHERGGTRDRYAVREGALPHDLAANITEIDETWAAGGPDKEAIGRRWFVERRNGVERNSTSFTKDQTLGRLPEGFDSARHNIVIFNSTMEEYASIKGWESPIYRDEAVGVRQVVETLASNPNVHVYLRVHPHLKHIAREDNYQLRMYAELESRAKNLTVIWPESTVHTYELMDRCKAVLTFGSTTGVEACFWGTPSVLAGHALYEGLDCAYVPKTHEEVVRLLTGDLSTKDQLGALKYGYWESERGITFKRFRATSLYSGEWLGRPCRPSLAARVQSAVLRLRGR